MVAAKTNLSYAVTDDVEAIRKAYHRGEVDEDRTYCDDCKHLYYAEAHGVALGRGETPAHPPVRGTIIRARCRAGECVQPGRAWRCPRFSWAE